VAQRPITGYGFSAFWGTPEVIYGLGDNSTWVNLATDAHNAYLNLAVTIGLPGMFLTIVWFVILPIMDYYRRVDRAGSDPLHTLFLRVCLFGTFESCFESSMFQQVGEVWFFYLVAAFGLRLLALMPAAA
jgi:O-antigen ligase